MMKIKDLAVIEALKTNCLRADRVRGGLDIGIALIDENNAIGDTSAVSFDSLYRLFDNGFLSVSAVAIVYSNTDYSISFSGSSSTISIA